MRLRKLWATALVMVSILLVALTAGSCSPGADSGKIKIGFSMDTLKEERWQRDHDLVKRYAEEAGAEIQIQVANGDNAQQSRHCEDFLTKGVDVLIVAPTDGDVAASIVEMAKRQNVPVISYDRLIKNSEPSLYVSHQVTKIGEMQGRYALEHAPRGNYVLIRGDEGDHNATLLYEGQMSVLKPAEDSGAIKIVYNQPARKWLASEARRFTDDALTLTGNNIQAIVASNDGTASGAVAALAAAGLNTGQVLVTGQDAALDAIQRIVQGEQTMTIYKPIKPLAKSAVDAALKLARGEKIDAPDRIPNGKIDVPAILHEPYVVDKNNVLQTVVADGYHEYDKVYANVPADRKPPKPATVSGNRKSVSSSLAAVSCLLLLAAFVWVKVR